MSMIPGVTHRPWASMTSAPVGADKFCPTALTRPLTMRTSVPSSRVPVPVSTVALRINVGGLGGISYIEEYGARVDGLARGTISRGFGDSRVRGWAAQQVRAAEMAASSSCRIPISLVCGQGIRRPRRLEGEVAVAGRRQDAAHRFAVGPALQVRRVALSVEYSGTLRPFLMWKARRISEAREF